MLAAIGIVYFAFARKKMLKGIVAAVVIVGLCFTLPTYSFAFWENDIALEDESIYNYLQVKDSDGRPPCPPTCCSACSPSSGRTRS